jgi:hypothetical protein
VRGRSGSSAKVRDSASLTAVPLHVEGTPATKNTRGVDCAELSIMKATQTDKQQRKILLKSFSSCDLDKCTPLFHGGRRDNGVWMEK